MDSKNPAADTTTEQRRTFGQLLTSIIEAKGVKQRAIAAKVGITPAYLSRIKNDLKHPSRETVHRLVVALGLSPEGEEARQLREAAGGMRESDDDEASANVNKQIEKILAKFSRNPTSDPGGSARLAPLPDSELKKIRPIIVGEEAMVEAIITVLRVTASRPPTNTPIFLKLDGIIDLRNALPEHLRDKLLDAVRLVLQKGWNIQRLWMLDHDDQTTVPSLVADLLDLLGYKGRYQPCYIYSNQERYLPWARLDLLVVPKVAGLVLTRTGHQPYPDTAFFFQGDIALEEIERQMHFQRGQAFDLLKVYAHPRRGNLPFDNAITEAEEIGGDRCLFKDGLSVLHIPLDVVSGRARKPVEYEVDQDTLEQLYLNRQRRLEAFRHHREIYTFRDICPKATLELLVKKGIRPEDAFLEGMDGKQNSFTLSERKQILETLLEHLKEPNFELALMKPDPHSSEFLNRIFWEVIWNSDHKRGKVLIETFPRRKEKSTTTAREEYDLVIEERSVVRAFAAYFNDYLWNKIPEKDRNKDKVRRYLEGQLKWLQNQLDAELCADTTTEQ
jgi:transcriptional regulator with XRE-family HTH domain